MSIAVKSVNVSGYTEVEIMSTEMSTVGAVSTEEAEPQSGNIGPVKMVRGEKGDPGFTPSFSIGTVTTLEAGSDAEASITGTDEKPVLNLGIPRGETGKNGIPAGGTAGQYLRKVSDSDYDVEWADFGIPAEYGLITYDNTKTITIT